MEGSPPGPWPRRGAAVLYGRHCVCTPASRLLSSPDSMFACCNDTSAPVPRRHVISFWKLPDSFYTAYETKSTWSSTPFVRFASPRCCSLAQVLITAEQKIQTSRRDAQTQQMPLNQWHADYIQRIPWPDSCSVQELSRTDLPLWIFRKAMRCKFMNPSNEIICRIW